MPAKLDETVSVARVFYAKRERGHQNPRATAASPPRAQLKDRKEKDEHRPSALAASISGRHAKAQPFLQASLQMAIDQRERAAERLVAMATKTSQLRSALTRRKRVSGEGANLRRLSRDCAAGAGRHRTSTTGTCVHGGLLCCDGADCIGRADKSASKKSIKERLAGNIAADSNSFQLRFSTLQN